VFDTLESCKAAERAINARENKNFDDECTKEVKNSDLKNKTY
jgi:tRNA(Arg) A34 adenosine deaminase TadA